MEQLEQLIFDQFLDKEPAEIIRVDFKNQEKSEKSKGMVIISPDGKFESVKLVNRPSMAELTAIVEGFPKRCSVRYKRMTRTLIYNGHGCIRPYELNIEATKLRTMAMFDPSFQVWGTAILLIGFRVGKI